MRKIVVFLLFVLCTAAQAQSLTLFDLDTTAFPTMKAKFYTFDGNWEQITNLSPSDFELTENGVKRTVTNVSCPAPKEPETLSSVLVVDISGSMGLGIPQSIESAKKASNAWIDGLPTGKSECALVTFSTNSFIVQDFTMDKQVLKNKVEQLIPTVGTNYNQALFDEPCGGLHIAKTGKYKRVLIFLTDGEPNFEPKTQEIINLAIQNNITIYGVTLNMPAPKCIKEMTTQTGGTYFENITTMQEAEETYRKLLTIAQGAEPCTIEWTSGIVCKSNKIAVNAKVSAQNIEDKLTYLSPGKSVVNLIIKPSGIYFKNIPPGTTKDTNITVTAINSDFNVTNVTSSNSAFSIDKTSFFLAEGQSITLTVSYTPIDSAYSYTKYSFLSNICLNELFCCGGFPGIKPKVKTLKLTNPNGGEEFVAGSDTLITWEGIPAADTIKLEFSNDNGITWQNISDSATGLTYIWKNIPKPTSKQCLIRIKQFEPGKSNKDTLPQIEWQKMYGTNEVVSVESAESILQTNDGGYILAGSSWNNTSDGMIIKLNSNGEIEWKKLYGGSEDDGFRNIQETNDGGYIAVGSSGDVNKYLGSTDYWILKISSIGEIEWEKTYGGNNYDEAFSILQTNDGGYIVAGTSSSNDGDVTENKGDCDYWIIKINSIGKIEWQKTYGGSADEYAYSIQQTNNGGFIIAGYTGSNDGDVSENKGLNDCWIIKLNSLGKIEWQKTYGGSYTDKACSIQQTNDGGFIVAGYSNSVDGDVTENKGNLDYWVIKLNQIGEIEWQKTYGGSSDDVAYSIQQTNDSGYIVAGSSGDYTNFYGSSDYWIIKINQIGEIEWQKTYGGSAYDVAFSTQQTIDDGYIICGFSRSNDGDVPKNKGEGNIWVIKLSPKVANILQEDVSDSLFAVVAPQASADDIDMKQCLVGKAKDSVITPFVSNIGTYKFKVDSIYFSGSDANCFSLVSGFSQYELTPNASHYAEIHFVPKRVGLHSAQINIITQSDTLIKNIIGEGVEPQLKILTELLDFGKIKIGKDTIIKDTAVLKNISNSNITISNVVQLGPDLTQFEIVDGGGSFTLAPNEERKLSIKFKPIYEGRTSGQFGFEYNGVGSPAMAILFGTGIDSSISDVNDLEYSGGKPLFYGSGKAGLLSIIPNPADDEVTLTINTIEEGDTYIYIYNALGMEIYKNIIISDASGKKEIKLNTSNYSAGVYYIKFQTPTWNEYNKLIIGR